MVSLVAVRARHLAHLPVLVTIVFFSCTTAEAPLPPRVSIVPRTVTVGDTVMMKETVQGVQRDSVWWLDPVGRKVVQSVGGGVFYGSGVGTAMIKVQLVADTGAMQHVVAEDSTLLTVVAPPASNRPAFTQLDASTWRACGLSAAGEVFCWGNTPTRHSYEATCEAPFHQSYPWFCNSIPAKLSGIPQFKFIDGGTAAECGITMQGEAYCWPALASSVPFGVFGLVPTNARFTMLSVEMGPNFNFDGPADVVCGLTATGEIHCWQRGNSQTNPQQISGAVKYKTVSVGGYWRAGSNKYRACALDMNGAAFCWGTASLGDGNPAPSSEQTTPVAVGGSLRFDSITLGGLDACGLTSIGEVYCWGSDEYRPVLAPTLIRTTVRFKAISAADAIFCGIATDSTLYCWSNYPQLGQPTQVSTTYHFSTISVGDPEICGLTVEGPEVCWGPNLFGELGNGSIGISAPFPTPIAGQRVYP
jgi:hypothetical protein